MIGYEVKFPFWVYDSACSRIPLIFPIKKTCLPVVCILRKVINKRACFSKQWRLVLGYKNILLCEVWITRKLIRHLLGQWHVWCIVDIEVSVRYWNADEILLAGETVRKRYVAALNGKQSYLSVLDQKLWGELCLRYESESGVPIFVAQQFGTERSDAKINLQLGDDRNWFVSRISEFEEAWRITRAANCEDYQVCFKQ